MDQTVVDNEAEIDGKGWRSGAAVERREIPQWFIKITAYAEELLSDLDKLPKWPEQVKTMQKNWIGKSRGMQMTCTLETPVNASDGVIDSFDIYTTRPDTVMGITYMSLAAEHPICLALAKNNTELSAFIAGCKKQSVSEADMSTMEKLGIDTGLQVHHPLHNELIPVWVANYVLMDYGSGAVMAVPAHDVRDYAFAKQYGLAIKQVITDDHAQVNVACEAFTDKGLLINSGQFEGRNVGLTSRTS